MNCMIPNKATLVAFAFLFILGTFNVLRADENIPKQRTVQVTGEGKVEAVPDQAEMDFEVQDEGDSAEDLTAKVNKKMKGIFDVIQSFGISQQDVKTVRYDIRPKYSYFNGQSEMDGFTASNRVHVVLKKIDVAGELLDAVTKAGATQIDGPNFGFFDSTGLQIEALKKAMENAHAKAAALAETSGAELGKVFSITQTGSTLPVRPLAFRAKANVANDEVPIATGENEVTAEVEVVYLLK